MKTALLIIILVIGLTWYIKCLFDITFIEFRKKSRKGIIVLLQMTVSSLLMIGAAYYLSVVCR